MKESADPAVERAGVYDRPSARFDWEGQLEVRASAASGCRRALWYAATGHEPAPPSDEALTVMETGRALEPVVLHAMQRAGWEVTPADAKRTTRDRHPAAHPHGEGDGPSRRHRPGAPLRGRGRHRGEDPRPRRLQALAGAGGGAEPPGRGRPGGALHLRALRRGPRRRPRRHGHGRPRLGHGGDPRGAGGARPGADARVACSPGRALRHARRGSRSPARARLRGGQLALPVLPLPRHLPTGQRGGEHGTQRRRAKSPR